MSLDGKNILHFASERGNVELVKLIVQLKLLLNVEDSLGRYPKGLSN